MNQAASGERGTEAISVHTLDGTLKFLPCQPSFMALAARLGLGDNESLLPRITPLLLHLVSIESTVRLLLAGWPLSLSDRLPRWVQPPN
jgi:hypothetical protein